MAFKDCTIQVKVTQEMQDRIAAEAEKQAINPSQYVREAIDFYSSFNVYFLEHINSTAKK